MKEWIQEHPWGFGVMIFITLGFSIGTFCLTHWLNQKAGMAMATKPHKVQTEIYLGHNPSAQANAITGSTVHLGYDDFVEHSKNATETYLVKEYDDGHQADVEKIYALMANGHTYSTTLPAASPDNGLYCEAGRSFDRENGTLIITWQINPDRLGIDGYFVIFLVLGFMIFVTFIVAKAYTETRKTPSKAATADIPPADIQPAD